MSLHPPPWKTHFRCSLISSATHQQGHGVNARNRWRPGGERGEPGRVEEKWDRGRGLLGVGEQDLAKERENAFTNHQMKSFKLLSTHCKFPGP